MSKPTSKTATLLTVRCASCADATVSAYDDATLHEVLKKFDWAWLNGSAICHHCLVSDDPRVARTIRELQGVYLPKELTEHG